jgi:hypothetical protein
MADTTSEADQAIVRRWLDSQPTGMPPADVAAAAARCQARLATAPPAPRPETAAQRFAKLDRSQPPRSDLPAWRDPRS